MNNAEVIKTLVGMMVPKTMECMKGARISRTIILICEVIQNDKGKDNRTRMGGSFYLCQLLSF